MSRVAVLCGAALLIACAPSGEQAETADTTADTPMAAPATISLADVAGTWNIETMAMGSDSVLVTGQLVATGTMDGWMMTLPNRDPVPVRVLAVEGDSIMTEMGPFPSVLREGVMVTTRSVFRLRDSALVGQLTAQYAGGGADSVLTLRSRGTRAQ
jgi:hypothetical protein